MSNTFSTPKVVTTLNQSRLDYNTSITSVLDNFASAGQPNPASIVTDGGSGLRTGMLWYKSGADPLDGQGRLFVYNGSQFTRDGISTYKMANATIANSAAAAGTIAYGDLVLVGGDNLFMVNSANNAITRVGSDAITLSGLNSTQFLRRDIDSNTTGNVTFSGSGYVTLPKGSNANRPGTATSGMFRFNTDSSVFEGYDGVEWGEIGGGGAFTDDASYVYYNGGLNVGIGTATPDTDFQVTGSGTLLKLQSNAADTQGVTLRVHQTDTTITSGQSYGGIEWEGNDVGGTGVRGYLKGYGAGADGEFSLRMATQGSGASAPVDYFYLSSSGNVGLKVANPNTTLAVSGNVSFTGGDITLFNTSDGYLALGTNKSEDIRITSLGLFGVGTNNPDVGLHYRGNQPKLRIESNNSLDTSFGTEEIGRLEWEGTRSTNFNVGASIRVRQDGTWSTVDDWFSPTAMEFYTQDSSGSEITSPRMTITNKGNVGVGVSVPMSTFEVYGNVAANAFMVDGSNISNVWVNSNDYATLLAARSNDYATLLTAQSNDYATYTTLTSDYKANDYATLLAARSNDYATLLTAQSNDYATYTTLASDYKANDYATLLAARSNDYATLLTAQSNDYATYTTLTSDYKANDYATLLTAQSNDYATYTTLTSEYKANDYATLLAARSNDYATYTTLVSEYKANDYATLLATRSNDYATLLTAQSNDYASYITLNTRINTVQSNVSSIDTSLLTPSSNNTGYVGNASYTYSSGAFYGLSSVNLSVSGSVTEQVYAISGTTPVLEPDNGTIQTWTLTGDSTPTDGLSSGQYLILHIYDGTSYSITWPSVVWVGGSAPVLDPSNITIIMLWKVDSTIYGSNLGSAY
jgi:hypothetical protein